MRDRKNIIIILNIVLILGLLIEFARTEYLFKLGRNDNDYRYAAGYQKVDSVTDNRIKELNTEKYLIIYDSNENSSNRLKNNISRVFEYMKKEFDAVECSGSNILYNNYKSVIITVENLTNITELNNIMDYVFNGGKAFFAISPYDNGVFHNLYQKLGIYEVGKRVESSDIKLLSNVLIKGKGYSAQGEFLNNSSLSVRLTKDCNVHAISSDNTPLMWDSPYGLGKLMIFNGTMLDLKINRGFIAGAISLLNDDSIYPIMNLKVSFIDDFPAPIPKVYMENIYKGYGRNLSNFFRDVWWSDILKGAKNYNLKYSSMVIETYNDITAPPFDDEQSKDINSLIVYGREIIKSGGELGIHGYNHQPLAEEGFIKEDFGYKPWMGKEEMIASVKEATNYVGSIYHNYALRSYVPPSNILSPMGREALIEAMPDLKIISSLYNVYYQNESDDAYIQEFEVAGDGIVELPRISSGYEDSFENYWSILNCISSLGIYSHFIHPDDILDMERSRGKTWDELSREYDSLLSRVYNNYKWLRSMTVSEAGMELENYQDSQVFIEHGDESINVYCNNFVKDMYFILRTNKKVLQQEEYEIFDIDDNVYLVHGKKASLSIKFK